MVSGMVGDSQLGTQHDEGLGVQLIGSFTLHLVPGLVLTLMCHSCLPNSLLYQAWHRGRHFAFGFRRIPLSSGFSSYCFLGQGSPLLCAPDLHLENGEGGEFLSS